MLRHPIRAYRFWRKALQYPKVGQVVKYNDILVRVAGVHYNRDDLLVRWYDGSGRHDAIISWTKSGELP